MFSYSVFYKQDLNKLFNYFSQINLNQSVYDLIRSSENEQGTEWLFCSDRGRQSMHSNIKQITTEYGKLCDHMSPKQTTSDCSNFITNEHDLVIDPDRQKKPPNKIISRSQTSSPPCVKREPGLVSVENSPVKTMLMLLDVYYKNYKLFYKNSFQAFLFPINDTMQVKLDIGRGVNIEEAFLNWKGDLEQIDDVCVIGVRI